MIAPGRLAAPVLILAVAACSQAAPANKHQLQARLSSIPNRCGVEKVRLTATSAATVTMKLPGDMPSADLEKAAACVAGEVKKISGASLAPNGVRAAAAE